MASPQVPSVGRIPIVGVGPVLEGGRWPARAVVGEAVPITATIFREGHDLEGATVVVTRPSGRTQSIPMPVVEWGKSLYQAIYLPSAEGLHSFRVEAWSDPVGTWAHAARVKIHAGVDVQLMLDEGIAILNRAIAEVRRPEPRQDVLRAAVASLGNGHVDPEARLAPALSDDVRAILTAAPLRDWVTSSPEYPLEVQRERALASAWYEIFPRSEGAKVNKRTGEWASGTFTTAAKRLPGIAAMGFDVVYLTPIHPIGLTHRKGRNNSLRAEPGDPGSPYAIGGPEGGHDAIHPQLGTLRQFRNFTARAHELGLEVALDLALQCSPDHPWVTEHPEWFTTRMDGTIAYAENPPKKYQDIYPLNFDNDPLGIREEILRVVRHWIELGVTIFRVDNPHTKPLDFWEWLIFEVNSEWPEIVFFAEAFTRPAMMQALAGAGFQQSYSYFTWRNTKEELEEFLVQISDDWSAFYRPNLFVNTPDILTEYLQFGGQPAYQIRAALAATASPSWGVYSGFELFEDVARPGSEENIDNEKFEYKPRDFGKAERLGASLAPYLRRLNDIRNDHPALRQLRNLSVHWSDDDAMLVYSKFLDERFTETGTPDGIIVVANVDPHSVRETTIHLDPTQFGLTADSVFDVVDLITDQRFTWAQNNYVRLDAFTQPVHILAIDYRQGN